MASTVLLLAILVHVAEIASLPWRVVGPAVNDGEAGPIAAVQAANAAKQEEQRRLAQLVEAHLFGVSPPQQSVEPVAAPAEWVLSATLQGPTPESGSAILGQSRESTRFHAAGQEILSGYTLTQVFLDRVTIEHGGQLMVVRLPRERLPLGPGLRMVAANTSLAPAPAPAPAQRLHGPPPNRPLAMTVLRPMPHLSSDGHYAGMRVWGSGNGSALLQLGLQRNDVITHVDGRPINSTEAARQALNELSTGVPIKVTVERNGAPEDISLTFVDNRS